METWLVSGVQGPRSCQAWALVLLGLASSLAVTLAERPARACGGCFLRAGTENTVVTDHRMAFSLSTQQTVLWDQIKYAGNPAEFSWVLPVRAGAVVQLSHDEWFAALDAMTQPVITGPIRNCSPNSGISCASSKSFPQSWSGAGDEGNSVEVISQSVVGPYDTVTLKATDPQALETWLDVNGFALPDSFRPTIAAYVSEGFDFIALRLRPGEGVQSMQPVRVVTQGADATLPLRMVAAGVGAQVGITLYIVSEGRYEARAPFFNAVIDDSKLVWFRAQSRSNYQELSQQLMQGNNGRTWLTEFAGTTSLVKSPFGGGGYCSQGVDGGVVRTTPGESLADIYFLECQCKGGNDCVNSGTVFGAPLDASFDAGCSADPCAGFDDLDVALAGLHPHDTWVTRMRSILPVDALSEGDLHIQASVPQAPVSNAYSANTYDDPTYSPCGTKGGCSASAVDGRSYENWLVAGSFAFAGIALFRRRRLR